MEEPIATRKLVYVRFPNVPTPYIFNSGDIEIKLGDMVVVETEIGKGLVKILGFSTEEDASGLEDIKPVLRVATAADIKRLDEIKEKEKHCYDFCKEKIISRALPMKLSSVDITFDMNKITFFFTAEGRVDFRDLLKDLVEKYRTRIELRQIGSRQESAILGGIGSCGRELCCATFLNDFQRISVKMAKSQNMTLNPSKISGLCGKLKCCLAYEKESYANLIDNLPKPGKIVFIPQGEAIVVSINVINQTFIAKVGDRRFIKSNVSDILTEEEFNKLSENKGDDALKQKMAAVNEIPFGDEVHANDKQKESEPLKKKKHFKRRRPKRGPES